MSRKVSAEAAFEKYRHAYIGTAAAFAEVVSGWDEPLRCQTGQSPRPCRNPARWLGLDHDCNRKLLCTFHKQR